MIESTSLDCLNDLIGRKLLDKLKINGFEQLFPVQKIIPAAESAEQPEPEPTA